MVPHYNERIESYTIRYVKRPQPIVLLDMEDTDLTIEGFNTIRGSELDPMLHPSILERAVTLAKLAAAGTTPTLGTGQKNQKE